MLIHIYELQSFVRNLLDILVNTFLMIQQQNKEKDMMKHIMQWYYNDKVMGWQDIVLHKIVSINQYMLHKLCSKDNY
jgi:hypothetical protein